MARDIFDFGKLESMQFQALCQKLLTKISPDYETVGAPDGGLDGINRNDRIGYQIYHPLKGARKSKIQSDLKKISKRWRNQINEVIWLTSFEWTEKNRTWCEGENITLKYSYWGPERISEKLTLYSELIDQFHLQAPHKNNVTPIFNINTQRAETIQNINANEVKIRNSRGTRINVSRARDPNALTPDQQRAITDEIERIARSHNASKEKGKKIFRDELGKMKKVFRVRDWRDIPSYRFNEVMEHFRRQKYANRMTQTPQQERDGLIRSIYGKAKDIGWGDYEIHDWLRIRFAKKSLRMCNNDELRLILSEINRRRDL